MTKLKLLQCLVGGALIVGSLWRIEQAPHRATDAAILAYQAGDFETALPLLEQAVHAGGSAAQRVQAQKNLALAALQVGDLETATSAGAAVAASGGMNNLAWHDFFLGNLAWERSRRAEVEAHGPVPPAGALERAIGQAEVASEAWQSALEMQNDWPEAQRNLDRAKLRLAALEEELKSATGAESPESEKMPSPSDASPPPMSEAKQLQLMQQLERLDQQSAEKKAASKPKSSGSWEW